MADSAQRRLIVALDGPPAATVESAVKVTRELSSHVGYVKVGLEFFCANGPSGVAQVARVSPCMGLFHLQISTSAGRVRVLS